MEGVMFEGSLTHSNDCCPFCRRGKKKQKHYTVFVCETTPEAKAEFQPKLNEEHRESRWWPVSALPPLNQLHPVVVSQRAS